MQRRTALRVKRTIDSVLSGVLILAFSPLIAGIALSVRLTMGSPVLFRQERLGHHGRPFTILKFRTMLDRRDRDGRLLGDEHRLTPIGSFLRRTTLDELPELINVLRGEMSIVGPRPLLSVYRERYTPEQWRRHEMPPGMAGPVVAGGRNALSWEEKFALDVWYVDNWSLTLDVKILWRALVTVLRRDGVSAADHVTMPEFTGTGASPRL
jgi:sugar transferase EpsL